MADMYIEYVTLQGDTFDIIALDFYNEETKSHLIMQANPQYVDVVVFDADVPLKIPLIEPEAVATLPPWKR